MTILTRRTLLAAIAQLAAAAPLAAQAIGGEPAGFAVGAELETLASVAYDIMPFDGIRPELYLRAAHATLAGNRSLTEQGLAELRKVVGNRRWIELDEATRIAALKSVEGSAFFGHLRMSVINTLFGDPDVWKLVGYGGPAVSQGGYIRRGFDEIDWLPAAGGN
jgi:hypothetical protein